MFPETHHGSWRGTSRLWLEPPQVSERSEGELQLDPARVGIGWSFRGTPHRGELRLSGPASSLRGDWVDSFHAADGMMLHGCFEQGVLRLYGTYPAGDGPAWGWRIEMDLRDPEQVLLRMFNVEPAGSMVPAVALFAVR